MSYHTLSKNEVELAKRRKEPTKLFKFLTEVSEDPDISMEITWEEGEYTGLPSCRGSIYQSIRRFGFPYKLWQSEGHLFLDK